VPELPEVETVTRGLRPVMEGASIARVEVRRKGLRFPFPRRFGPRLEGRKIVALTRRAKYILMTLDNEAVLLSHLGMTGRFVISPGEAGESPGPGHNMSTEGSRHEHVVFYLAGHAKKPSARIGYIDPRRFGIMDLVEPGGLDSHRLLAALGVEPLGPCLTPGYLQSAFAGKRAPLKAALMDQRIIAGLGNIYVCEALHRAGLSPSRLAGSLALSGKTKRLELLISAIVEILTDAIASGGSTLRDFAGADGALGYFQHNFSVYDREDHLCPAPRCGGTIGRIVQSGRSTYFCPDCQK